MDILNTHRRGNDTVFAVMTGNSANTHERTVLFVMCTDGRTIHDVLLGEQENS